MAKHYKQGRYKPKNPEKYLGKKDPVYRSSWEWTFCRFCDDHPYIEYWASEPFRIPYRNPATNENTIYVPDFFVTYKSRQGRRSEIVEIKPSTQTFKENVGKSKENQYQYVVNKAKWDAAYKFAKQKGLEFRVITEKDMFYQGNKW